MQKSRVIPVLLVLEIQKNYFHKWDVLAFADCFGFILNARRKRKGGREKNKRNEKERGR